MGGIEFSATPVTIIIEKVLSGTGLEDSVTGYGPGKFVFEGAHFLVSTIIKIRRMNTFFKKPTYHAQIYPPDEPY